MATRLIGGSQPAVSDLDGSLVRFERSVATGTDALDKEDAIHFAARLALYRALIAAIKQISAESKRVAEDNQPSFSSNVDKLESIRSSY
jgi:hypothetical protein